MSFEIKDGAHVASVQPDWPMPMVQAACDRYDAARAADDQQAAVLVFCSAGSPIV